MLIFSRGTKRERRHTGRMIRRGYWYKVNGVVLVEYDDESPWPILSVVSSRRPQPITTTHSADN